MRTPCLVVALAVLACQPPPPEEPAPASGNLASVDERVGGKGDGGSMRECLASFTPSFAAGWRHTKSRFISALGSPVHSASDVIVRPGASADLAAKLAYGGVLSKDLEDEWVWVFIHDCAAWRYVGYARTDGDGRAVFRFTAGLTPGVHDVRLEVVGDRSSAALRLWVLPERTHVAVFDVDGTLTTDDGELFEDILFGWTPEAYPAATDLAWAERSRDEVIVYLTGRPQILAGHTRAWLAERGFPAGALHLARTAFEVVPTNGGVGSYKAAFLASLRSAGLSLDDAFGNAGTDIYAYEQAGISKSRTWIIGPNAGDGSTLPVESDWSEVADGLLAEPGVDQPGW